MVDTVDVVVYIALAITTVALIVPLFLDYGDWMPIYGDVTVLLTHLFAVPAFLVLLGYLGDDWYTTHWRGWWYIVVLSYSFVVSICYHIAQIFDSNTAVVDGWDDADVSAQNLLLTNTVILLVYDTGRSPPWYMYPPTVVLAVLVAFYGNVSVVASVKVFEIIAGIIFIVLGVYVLVAHTTNATCYTLTPEYRDKTRLNLAMIFSLVGLGTFITASLVPRREYAIVHSIWHIYAYSLLYLILRSIKRHEDGKETPLEVDESNPFLPSPEEMVDKGDPFLDVDISELDEEHLLKL